MVHRSVMLLLQLAQIPVDIAQLRLNEIALLLGCDGPAIQFLMQGGKAADEHGRPSQTGKRAREMIDGH